jgi:Fe-S-cluster containining protein
MKAFPYLDTHGNQCRIIEPRPLFSGEHPVKVEYENGTRRLVHQDQLRWLGFKV